MLIYLSFNWSERRCAGGALQQGYAVTSKFIGIFSSLSLSSSELITQCVVVVVNCPASRQRLVCTTVQSHTGQWNSAYLSV